MDQITPNPSEPAPPTPDEDDGPDHPLVSAGWALAMLALAVGAQIPSLWEQVADPDARGRRSGWKHLFASIGPWPFTVVFGLLALFFVWQVVRAFRAPADAEGPTTPTA